MLKLFFMVWLIGVPLWAQPPDLVHVSAYINDIHFVDLKNHTYSVDFYLSFRWSNPKIDAMGTFEFMNPFELWGFSIKPESEHPVKLPNGDLYNTVRVEGKFSKKFDLSNYPFDKQELKISFEDSQSDQSRIRYIPDDAPAVAFNPSMSLPGFDLGTLRMETEEFTHPTAFGNAAQRNPQSTFSRLNILIPVQRPVLAYMLKLLLPILCVFFCSGLMFLIAPQFFDARIGIGITALLTVVALQITLNEELPEIGYLVLIDKIYLLTYLFIILSLANVVRVARQLDQGICLSEGIVRSDRRLLLFFSFFYFLFCSILILRGVLS